MTLRWNSDTASYPTVGKFCLFDGDTEDLCVYPSRWLDADVGETRLLGLIVFAQDNPGPGAFPIIKILTAHGTIDNCKLWDPCNDEVVEDEDLAELVLYTQRER